jgi:hypothetical protein
MRFLPVVEMTLHAVVEMTLYAMVEIGRRADFSFLRFTWLVPPAEARTIEPQYDGTIHLISTDVAMPGMNGKVLFELRQNIY